MIAQSELNKNMIKNILLFYIEFIFSIFSCIFILPFSYILLYYTRHIASANIDDTLPRINFNNKKHVLCYYEFKKIFNKIDWILYSVNINNKEEIFYEKSLFTEKHYYDKIYCYSMYNLPGNGVIIFGGKLYILSPLGTYLASRLINNKYNELYNDKSKWKKII